MMLNVAAPAAGCPKHGCQIDSMSTAMPRSIIQAVQLKAAVKTLSVLR